MAYFGPFQLDGEVGLAFGTAKILFSTKSTLAWLNCAKKGLKVHK